MSNNKTILIIDDEAGIREYLKFIIEGAGHTVLEADNGGAGILLDKENVLFAVFCDMIMPGKEGVETISTIKKQHPDIRIFAMSGVGNKDLYMERALHIGAIGILSKPFKHHEPTDLLEK